MVAMLVLVVAVVAVLVLGVAVVALLVLVVAVVCHGKTGVVGEPASPTPTAPNDTCDGGTNGGGVIVIGGDWYLCSCWRWRWRWR